MNGEYPELLPVSALQHLVFCPRQCALIHVEKLWVENVLTAEGRVLHSRQDKPGAEIRKGICTRRAVHVFSRKLGIWGVCDSIEEENSGNAVRYTPVEAKHGRPKRDRCDEVQLCAQALCLEEMHGTHISEAFLFYAETRRRTQVAIDDALRSETLALVMRLRDMIEKRETPPPDYGPKCKSCSLVELCKPDAIGPKRAGNYVKGLFKIE